MQTITAVVVTYNRLPLLKECIAALRAQTRMPTSIIVVNNASTDDTRTYLDELASENFDLISSVHLTQNTGGAGGFNEGIKRAYQANADWVWVMDDDCIPQPECLEKLLDAGDLLSQERQEIGFLSSRVLWTDGTPCRMNIPFQHTQWIAPHSIDPKISRIAGASFVSMLISRAAITQHGLPVKEFFIWFDDAEYSRRIAATLPGYLVTSSIAIHKSPQNIAALDFGHMDIDSLWKFKYGVRNQCSYHFENDGVIEGILFIGKILVHLSRAPCGWNLRLSIIGSCVRGFLFRYRRYIEHI